MKKFSWIFGIFIIFIIFFTFSLDNNPPDNSLQKNGVLVQGTVEDLIQSQGRAHNAYAPKITFTTKNNEVIHFTSKTYTGPSLYHVGDKVPMLYDSANPNNAVINTFSSKNGQITLELLVFVIGVLLLIFMKKQRSKSSQMPKSS